MGRSVVSEELGRYVAEEMTVEPAPLKALRQKTNRLPNAVMAIGPDQARFIRLLVQLTGAKRAIEVGTFTGVGALSIALGLPEDGKLICCDIDEGWTSIGRPHWEEAGVAGKIDLRLQPASTTLQQLLDGGGAGQFDFAFIDADKPGYPGYYAQCLELMRPGGVVLLDNMLWNGAVAKPVASMDRDTRVLHQLNVFVREDPRVDAVLLTVGDGMILARKK